MLPILKLLTWTESGFQPVSYDLALGVVGALLGFFGAYRYHQVTGINPWKIPAYLWAIFAFLSPLGLVLEVIARAVGEKRIFKQQNGVSLGKRNHVAGWVNNSSQQIPVQDHLTTDTYEPKDQNSMIDDPEKTHLPLFGWYPDIYEKYTYRYWDGKSWTKFVSDGKSRSVDNEFPQ